MNIANMLLGYIQNDLLAVLAVGVGSYLVISQMEKRRNWPWRIALAFLAISAWMIVLTVDYMKDPPLTLLIYSLAKYSGLFLLNMAAAMYYAKVDFFTALFAATVGYSIQHTCEKVWSMLNTYWNLPTVWSRIGQALLIVAVLYVYGRTAVWNKQYKRFNRIDRLGSKVPVLIAAAVMGICILLDMLMYYSLSISGLSNPVTQHTRIYSAVASFLVLVVSMSHLRESDSQMRAEIADQLLHSDRARYEQDKAIHDAINIKCHDIRHQIAALGEKGYRKELQEIDGLINIYDTAKHSENTALDVVLANKSLACLNKGITFSCIADGRQLSFMADEDIYSLFGNILDNAIDAVSGFSDPERRIISLNIRMRAGCLIIEEENFYEGKIVLDDGIPVTSKIDKAYHGFGMQSIQLLTNRYEGNLQLDIEENIFKLSILLPIPEEQTA